MEPNEINTVQDKYLRLAIEYIGYALADLSAVMLQGVKEHNLGKRNHVALSLRIAANYIDGKNITDTLIEYEKNSTPKKNVEETTPTDNVRQFTKEVIKDSNHPVPCPVKYVVKGEWKDEEFEAVQASKEHRELTGAEKAKLLAGPVQHPFMGLNPFSWNTTEGKELIFASEKDFHIFKKWKESQCP